MKLFGIELFKSKVQQPVQEIPIKSLNITNAEVTPEVDKQKFIRYAKLKPIGNPVLSYKQRSGVLDFEQPEYDFAEIGRIEDVESYVRRAFTLKDALMFKEGYEFTGKNIKTIQYVKERLDQIALVTSLPSALWISGVGEDLIRFHNAFVVKVRKAQSSGGKRRQKIGGKWLEPVAGYFHIPIASIRLKRDEFGNVKEYRQIMPNGTWKDFAADDVIHFYMARKKGFLVGTPSLIPVKDDIRALRRIEENIELLVYQHLFPLFHYKVGSENAPAREYPDGTTEIDIVKQEIELMPSEGMIVTSERHEVTALGSEGRALRAEGYLTHFRERVFSGLGVSAIDMGMGDTSNRSTADSMSRNLVDDVKQYQRFMEIFVNEYVIKELLLESTFENALAEENIVTIQFKEIDLDAKIKVENHALNSYKGYALQHDEMRRMYGFEPMTDEDWQKTFWSKVEEPRYLIQAVDEPYLNAAARNENTSLEPEDVQIARKNAEAERKAKIRPVKPNGGQNAAKAATTPSNQHGTKTGPEKRKSSIETIGLQDMYESVFISEYNKLKSMDPKNWLNNFSDTIKRMSRLAYTEATNKYNKFAKADFDTINNRIARVITNFSDNFLTVSQTQNRQIVMELFKDRAQQILFTEPYKAYQLGLLAKFKNDGIVQICVKTDNNACSVCKQRSLDGVMQDINNFNLDNLPCYHPNCYCTISKDGK